MINKKGAFLAPKKHCASRKINEIYPCLVWGFTIIELLVVIAIIGVLSSLIVINLKSTKERAEQKKAMEFAHTVRASLGEALVGEWTFDDTSNLGKDTSGYENHGTVHGASPVDGIIRGALSFDGVSNYSEVPDSSSLDSIFGVTIWTLEAWAYPRTWQNWASLINKANDGWYSSATAGIWTSLEGFSAVIGSNQPGNPADSIVKISYKPPLNAWYHIVAVANGSDLLLFVNGDSKGSVEITDYIKNNLTSNNASLTIGRRCVGCPPSFDGIIDEVRIYNRALTTAQIQKHYAEGAARHGIALK